MRIYRTDAFPLPLPPGHRFPAEKYAMLAESVTAFAADRLDLAPATTQAELELAHDATYVWQVLDGKLSATLQKTIGLPWSPQLAERSQRSVGATIAAARSALHYGCGIHLAGGTHHAMRAQGAGFCVFNDIAVTALLALQEGLARRVLVLDLDVHQGNGTAAILRHEPRAFTFSMHGARNYPFEREASDWDIDLPDDTGDADYLAQLRRALPVLFQRAAPDLVLYLAGADPYRGDRLGRLALSQAALAKRDRLVMEACRQRQTAIAITMAGGYAQPISDTVAIQTETVRLACDLFASAH